MPGEHVTWFFQTFAIFVANPSLAFVVGALFGGLFCLSYSKVIAAAAKAWCIYGVYEYLMHFRVLCTGECNIRVDLLLIYPVLALISVIALFSLVKLA